MPEGAYTTYLFNEGIDKICKKVGEEATEVVIGAKNRDPEEVKWESADLIYHLLVLLQEQKISVYDVLEVLVETTSTKERSTKNNNISYSLNICHRRMLEYAIIEALIRNVFNTFLIYCFRRNHFGK